MRWDVVGRAFRSLWDKIDRLMQIVGIVGIAGANVAFREMPTLLATALFAAIYAFGYFLGYMDREVAAKSEADEAARDLAEQRAASGKALASRDARILELEQRPTREELDAANARVTELKAARDKEVTELKAARDKEVAELKARIKELEEGPVRRYEELMRGVQEDAAKARDWLRGFDAQQLGMLWQSWRDCDWDGVPPEVRHDMNLVMNNLPKVFREEYARIVGKEPDGWVERTREMRR